MRLLGTRAIHDGPNCFNAAAYLHGFVDSVAMVGAKEMDFYLKRFCKPVSGEPQRGDILTLTSGKNSLEHAGTVMDRDVVFEKASYSGQEGKTFHKWVADHPTDYRYVVVRRRDSRWFSGENPKTDGMRREIHRCPSMETVKAKLSALRKGRIFELADRIKLRFQDIALSPEKLNWSAQTVLRQDIAEFVRELEKLDAKDPSTQLANAIGDSFWQNLIFNSKETPFTPDAAMAFNKLDKELDSLDVRIWQAKLPVVEASSIQNSN